MSVCVRLYGIALKNIHCDGKTIIRKQNALATRTPELQRRLEDQFDTDRRGRPVGANVGTRLGPPRYTVVAAAAAARLPRYARAGTDARCVRPPRTMGKTPATTPLRQSGGGGGVPPRRGCTTARVQHPAVEISGTGLGDAPPERDPYTIKIARVGTYNTRTTTIILLLRRRRLQLLQHIYIIYDYNNII